MHLPPCLPAKLLLQPGTDPPSAATQSARETLESSIRFVEGNPEWNARVVYGDTDSMFVLLPGRCASLARQVIVDFSGAGASGSPAATRLSALPCLPSLQSTSHRSAAVAQSKQALYAPPYLLAGSLQRSSATVPITSCHASTPRGTAQCHCLQVTLSSPSSDLRHRQCAPALLHPTCLQEGRSLAALPTAAACESH